MALIKNIHASGGIDLPTTFRNCHNLLSGANSASGLTVDDIVLITYVTSTDVTLPSSVSGLELLDSSVFQGDGSAHLSNVFAFYRVTNANVLFTIPTISSAYGNSCALFYN